MELKDYRQEDVCRFLRDWPYGGMVVYKVYCGYSNVTVVLGLGPQRREIVKMIAARQLGSDAQNIVARKVLLGLRWTFCRVSRPP